MNQAQVEPVVGHVFKIDGTCIVGIPHESRVGEWVDISLGTGADLPDADTGVRKFLPDFERFHGDYIAHRVVKEPAFQGITDVHPGSTLIFCHHAEDTAKVIRLTLNEACANHVHPAREASHWWKEVLNPIGLAEKTLDLIVPNALAAGPYWLHQTGRDAVGDSHPQPTPSGLYEHIDPEGPEEKYRLHVHGRAPIELKFRWLVKELFKTV